MSAKHTPGPWIIDEDASSFDIFSDAEVGTPFIASIRRSALSSGLDELARANARRIVACVNACEGVPTEVLEAEKYINSASFGLRRSIKKQRDELLAALEMVLDCDGDLNAMDFDMMRAAIAKAKGDQA